MSINEKKSIISFLEDLSQNNSKDWMDQNRDRYYDVKSTYLNLVQEVLNRLGQHDPMYLEVKPKETISRINNNRRFHPEKPVYKDFFSCDPAGKTRSGALFFFLIGVTERFIGGGFWKPSKDQLESIRDAIDYNGHELKNALREEQFQKIYGGLGDDPDILKTQPQNYQSDHEHVDLLRHKNFVALRNFELEDYYSSHFIDIIEESYLAILPFSDYLRKAVAG